VTRDNRHDSAAAQVPHRRRALEALAAAGARRRRLRPTPDRVRETLFNWLQHLRDRYDDARYRLVCRRRRTGFKLASGCQVCVLVESHPRALEGLRATRKRLAAGQTEIIAGEALAVAAGLAAASFDVVFLDPPFGAQLRRPALDAARRLVAPRGWIYLETPDSFGTDEAAGAGLELVRSGRAGRVAFHLLRLPSA
jgi:16S rRNA G966 N2-methylase RsmD